MTACSQRLRKHGLHCVACVRGSLYFFILIKKAGSGVKEVDVGGEPGSLQCGTSCSTFFIAAQLRLNILANVLL